MSTPLHLAHFFIIFKQICQTDCAIPASYFDLVSMLHYFDHTPDPLFFFLLCCFFCCCLFHSSEVRLSLLYQDLTKEEERDEGVEEREAAYCEESSQLTPETPALVNLEELKAT